MELKIKDIFFTCKGDVNHPFKESDVIHLTVSFSHVLRYTFNLETNQNWYMM